MTCALSIGVLLAAQGIPGRAVEMEATLGGKPYGTVIYYRSIVPGKGMERMLTLRVQREDETYEVQERRTYAHGGVPTSVVRTYTDGDRKITVSVAYEGKKAVVTHSEGAEVETEEVALEQEGATTTDPSQFWFFGSVPNAKAESKFWEYSIDEDAWVERKVRYEGIAKLKLGEKNVDAHRISIGGNTNFYVDEHGMPYKSVQKTEKGELVLVRTKPEVAP